MPAKPHFNVDPAFPHSKEILSIPRRYRLHAAGAWQAAGCWSCDKLTDGWVPVRALIELLITPALADHLLASTLWIPAVDNAPTPVVWTTCVGRTSAVQFENWDKWQMTKAKWERAARANADRQQRHRKRTNRENDLIAEENNALRAAIEQAGPDISANNRNALPTNAGEVSRERYLSREVSAVGGGPGDVDQPPLPEFPNHCKRHRHDPDPPPCHDCRRTREANEQREAVESVKAIAARETETALAAAAREECRKCDPAGWVTDVWGEPVEPARKCRHE